MPGVENSSAWRGYIPALVTPFRASDGALDEDGVDALVGWVLDRGVHGVAVAGTLGEWTTLSDRDREALVSVAAARTGGRAPLLVGCTSESADRALSRIRRAAADGADGALVALPPYIVPSEREVAAYFAELAARTALPLCVYNWPPGTGVDLSPQQLSEIARHDSIVAIKSSTPVRTCFRQTVELLADRARVFGVSLDARGLELLDLGAAGTIGASGVLASDQSSYFECYWRGDRESAIAAGRGDSDLLRSWFDQRLLGRFASAPAILKEALAARGLPSWGVRRPLLPLDPAGRARVRSDLERIAAVPA